MASDYAIEYQSRVQALLTELLGSMPGLPGVLSDTSTPEFEVPF